MREKKRNGKYEEKDALEMLSNGNTQSLPMISQDAELRSTEANVKAFLSCRRQEKK